jgi:acyl carrier protein
MSSIEERVKRIICDQLSVSEDEVAGNASFVDDLGGKEVIRSLRTWSKLPIVVLSARDEEAEKIVTVQQAVDYITANAQS